MKDNKLCQTEIKNEIIINVNNMHTCINIDDIRRHIENISTKNKFYIF